MEEYFAFEPGKIVEEKSTDKSSGFKQIKKKFPKNQEEKIAIRKEIRKKKQERKKRLIIRNLSFKVKEDELKKEFSKFGDVVDVNIPKKPDGKMRGFAFVQYKSFQSAIEAVRNLNYQKLKGRPIAVDYAVAKDKYQHITSSKHTTNNPSKEPKEDIEKMISEESDNAVEKTDSDDSKSDVGEKSEEKSVPDAANDHVKKFLKEFNTDEESLEGAGDESEESCSESGSSSESDDDDDSSSSCFKRLQNATEEDEDMDSELATDTLMKRKASKVNGREPLSKKKNNSHDISEGKTVFIRNVSFDTDQDALKRTMETFGPVQYCLLVIDKFTELPRGTAFVKFEKKDDADKVIQKSSESNSEGIYLDGRKLYCTFALSQEELQSRSESGIKTRKDKRNLSLLKVGLIKKGSAEAEGVSQSDLTKRAKLEMAKRNKLKNLQFFVSDKRLCIHNIPSYYSDAELRKLFKNAAGPGAKVTEAKIMRNFKKVNAQGIAHSKGFGFVAFEKHNDALKAVMAMNNNPDVFTPQQRPIVEFSVENMNALLMKQRRKEKSIPKIKKDSENPEDNSPKEENFTLKFNKKRYADKKNMEAGTRKKMHEKTNSNKNIQQKKSKLEKDKMGNKSNRGRKPLLIKRKQHANNRPVQENPEKKKNKKQKKKKEAFSEGIGNFTQMVDKYKQKLLSNM